MEFEAREETAACLLLQGLDRSSHDILADAQRLDSHFLDTFYLADFAYAWDRAFARHELQFTRSLETYE